MSEILYNISESLGELQENQQVIFSSIERINESQLALLRYYLILIALVGALVGFIVVVTLYVLCYMMIQKIPLKDEDDDDSR